MPPSLTEPKQPKCSRCRHHGIIIPKKGHTKFCPFLHCECWKCFLISQRTRVSNLQRNLTRARNVESAKQRPGARGAAPAAEGTSGASDGGATSGQVYPQCASGGTPECAAPCAWSPVDLRSCRPEPGGQPVGGLDNRDVLPRASRRDSGSSCSGERGQAVPLPLPFPFSMPAHYPCSYPLPPQVLLHLPSFPAVPSGLHDGSLMFPPFQYPAPLEPAPAADCGPVFFTFHPLPPPESFPGGAEVEAASTASAAHKR
ncbi:uncharacterized protein [Leuresthes tenuis]|uniref:uncharacterized protein n=1 Tax=Leuresthes tenuis TaxID=355514 RepID=UPI003B50E244